MGRSRRVVWANTLYEIVPRVQEELPRLPTEGTNQLLTGILARLALAHGRFEYPDFIGQFHTGLLVSLLK
jgi:hypothetical protein